MFTPRVKEDGVKALCRLTVTQMLAKCALTRISLNRARILVLSAVAVAQLVESRIVIPVVVGSSPIGHPKHSNKNANLRGLAFLFECLQELLSIVVSGRSAYPNRLRYLRHHRHEGLCTGSGGRISVARLADHCMTHQDATTGMSIAPAMPCIPIPRLA